MAKYKWAILDAEIYPRSKHLKAIRKFNAYQEKLKANGFKYMGGTERPEFNDIFKPGMILYLFIKKNTKIAVGISRISPTSESWLNDIWPDGYYVYMIQRYIVRKWQE